MAHSAHRTHTHKIEWNRVQPSLDHLKHNNKLIVEYWTEQWTHSANANILGIIERSIERPSSQNSSACIEFWRNQHM